MALTRSYLIEMAGEGDAIRGNLLRVVVLDQSPQLCLTLVPQPLGCNFLPYGSSDCE